MGKLLTFPVVVGGLYFKKSDTLKPAPTPMAASEITNPASDNSSSDETIESGSSFDWGSGHQAGYDWAEEKSINDEGHGEAAGEHSNSTSFAEGCVPYINGKSLG